MFQAPGPFPEHARRPESTTFNEDGEAGGPALTARIRHGIRVRTAAHCPGPGVLPVHVEEDYVAVET